MRHVRRSRSIQRPDESGLAILQTSKERFAYKQANINIRENNTAIQ